MGDKPLAEKDEDKEGSDIARLKDKAQGGFIDVIEGALEEPQVKKIINRIIVRQSLESAVFLTCLLVGVLTIVNAFKVVLATSWQLDMASGIALITVGSYYVLRKLRA